MIEFTPAILGYLMLSGYKALKVEIHDKYHLIEQIKDLLEAEQFEGNNAYAIPIGDEQATEMTGKILLLEDHKFYIEERFIQ